MAEKPSYLGLLNAIAVNEARAYAYLSAWADVTPNPAVRQVLLTVAAREGEHGMSFAKRVNELGFEVRDTDDPGLEARMEIARSDRSDLQKVEDLKLLQFGTADKSDVFDRFFTDHSIDIHTGALLGRYIAEERDSLRLLQGCHAQLRAHDDDTAPADDRLGVLEEKLDAVSRAVDELRQIVCAQAMPTASA